MLQQLPRYVIPILILLGFYTLASTVSRSETILLLSVYSGLFVLLWFWIKAYSTLGGVLLVGILCRLVFFDHLPELSQDFYRYLWDGQLQLIGINPYLHTPNELISVVGFPDAMLLYEKMGSLSAGNFSNYPPASQFLFKLAALAHGEDLSDGVFVLRMAYFIGELGLFFVGRKLLLQLNLDPVLLAWYFLNPLVIVEGIGNLHGESLMLTFTLLGLLFLFQKKAGWAGVFMGLAIALKLIPLLFLPVFYRFLGGKRFLYNCTALLFVSLLIWTPFWEGSMAAHYQETLQLWFTTFEFNGSIYNIIRALGYQIKGYNIIRQLGAVTPFIVMGFVLMFSFLRSNRNPQSVLKSLLFILSSYFFIATTVHPWYIINLLFLGILSGYAYPIVWSLVVFWSYTAYGSEGFKESLFWQITAYSTVYGVLFWELFKGSLGEHFQKPNFFTTEFSPYSSR